MPYIILKSKINKKKLKVNSVILDNRQVLSQEKQDHYAHKISISTKNILCPNF